MFKNLILAVLATIAMASVNVTQAAEAKVLVLGQSNAANWLGGNYTFSSQYFTPIKLVDYNKDNPSQWLTHFSDLEIRNPNPSTPNLFANYFSCPSSEVNCTGESQWKRVGVKLMQNHGYTGATFYLGALPGTSIDDWLLNTSASIPTRNNGNVAFNVPAHLNKMLDYAVSQGVTDVVWMQGESDAWNGTSASYYSWALRTLASKVKQKTGKKLTVIHSTICHNNYTDPAVQAVVNGRNDAAATRPDLITLYESNDGLTGSYYRRDASSSPGCHLSGNGADYSAGSMAYAIANF